MNEEELLRRLESFASSPAPEVNEGFADRLESHLRVTGAELQREHLRRIPWRPLTGVLAAVLVVIAGLGVLRENSSDPLVIVMSAAQGTDVVLPSGAVIEGAEGLVLSEGAQIRVGEDGRAVVEGIVLTDGQIAVVANGRLEILDSVERTTTTATPSIPSSTTPPSTRPTTSSPPTSMASTIGSTTPTRPPTSIVDRAVAITLRSGVPTRSGVELSWTFSKDEQIAGWEVIAARGDSQRTIVVLRDPSANSVTVAAADPGSVTYWVVARNADGEELGRSNRVTP